MQLGKFSLLLMVKYCKSNIAIWSQWSCKLSNQIGSLVNQLFSNYVNKEPYLHICSV